ncbi:hypothetical protein [Levilactobacillus namurensis]|uniref:Phage protein n=1 Tax=Levilactobacillus namurensis TaxID=380393 RepID=A0AAW8WAR6_9LACO|nr:hypothetical protein [Levilactobacillus namurensis]MDT7015401.1 hypothetical protein [Levilactobacillus namurensis]
MDKKEALNKVQQLQNKALSLGMDWELDQSPMFAEGHLSDFISDVVDGTNENIEEISKEK